MNKKFSFALTFFLLLTLLLSGCGKKQEVMVEEKAINVETTQIAKKNITLTTTLSGTLKALEESSIVPKTPGKVLSVKVDIGDRVQKGDILFQLDQQDFANSVKQAEAAYNVSVANFKRTEEQIAQAKINYERMKTLYDQGAISQQQFEQYELQASDTNLEVVRYQVEQTLVGLENAKVHLTDCVVTAPISGVITSVNINEGEMASSAMTAVSIANIHQIVLEASLSEYLINKVHLGDEVEILVKSASEKPLKGKITALSPAPAKNSLTYPVKITLDNKESLVKPGMFGEVRIVSDQKDDVFSIPSDAIIIKDGYPIVFIINDNIAQIKKVSLGLDNGKDVEILKGLDKNDHVVIKGQNYLDEGSKVKVIK